MSVRENLHAALTTAAPLEALVGERIYFQSAPQGATYPLVIFHRQAPRVHRTMSDAVNGDLWTVKGVATGSASASASDAIAAAIDTALDGVAIAGTISVLRENDVDYPEQDGATLYRHLGGMYRVWSD